MSADTHEIMTKITEKFPFLSNSMKPMMDKIIHDVTTKVHNGIDHTIENAKTGFEKAQDIMELVVLQYNKCSAENPEDKHKLNIISKGPECVKEQIQGYLSIVTKSKTIIENSYNGMSRAIASGKNCLDNSFMLMSVKRCVSGIDASGALKNMLHSIKTGSEIASLIKDPREVFAECCMKKYTDLGLNLAKGDNKFVECLKTML